MSRTNLWSVFPQVLRSGRHGFRSVVKGQSNIPSLQQPD